MNKIIAIVLLLFAVINNSQAAVWVKLQENADSKLMLDKQSVIETDKLKRAWIKIVYKTPQTNIEVAEKTYNLSKLLWFFDCATQKAATSQVFQFSNDELIYSAAVDSKMAKFTEPVPETEIDVAMRYVCGVGVSSEVVAEKPAVTKAIKEDTKEPEAEKPADEAAKPKAPVIAAPAKPVVLPPATPAAPVKDVTKSAKEIAKTIETTKLKAEVKTTKAATNQHWSYEGKDGPEFWGKLSSDYTMCETGRSQSPINIDKTLQAVLKPLKTFQRFPAYDIVNNGHTIQINFKQGNMVALDSVLYNMKQLHFHAPSENTIHAKSYPLEAQFIHEDASGNSTIISVMFEEGPANEALTRLLSQLPMELNVPRSLSSRILASDLIPKNNSYYRFSGSLTTPPCTEGVSWIVMKTPMTASKMQIEAIRNILHHENNRPLQAINGRVVVE